MNKLKSYCEENLYRSNEKGFYSETAKLFGVNYERVRSTCRRIRKKIQGLGGDKLVDSTSTSIQKKTPDISIDSKEDSSFIQTNTHRIKSLEDLIKICNLDLNEWEIERYVTNKWEVGAVIDGEIIVEPLYQIKVWLRKKKIDESGKIEKSLESAINKMNGHSPDYSPINYPLRHKPHLLIIDAADIHIGKYASAKETGSSYDIEIAKNRALEGVKGILEKSINYERNRAADRLE